MEFVIGVSSDSDSNGFSDEEDVEPAVRRLRASHRLITGPFQLLKVVWRKYEPS
jgi:hypothetical protein